MYSFLPSSLLNARFCFHLIHPHLIIQCKVLFSSHSSSSHYSMQGFVFIIISSFWGGFIVNINKLYDFEMRALFSFPISEWILMWVHAEVDCFWLILPPFSGWLQNISVKQIFFPWLVQAREIKVVPEPPSAVFSVCQNCYQKLVFCWHVFLTDTQISNS